MQLKTPDTHTRVKTLTFNHVEKIFFSHQFMLTNTWQEPTSTQANLQQSMEGMERAAKSLNCKKKNLINIGTDTPHTLLGYQIGSASCRERV